MSRSSEFPPCFVPISFGLAIPNVSAPLSRTYSTPFQLRLLSTWSHRLPGGSSPIHERGSLVGPPVEWKPSRLCGPKAKAERRLRLPQHYLSEEVTRECKILNSTIAESKSRPNPLRPRGLTAGNVFKWLPEVQARIPGCGGACSKSWAGDREPRATARRRVRWSLLI